MNRRKELTLAYQQSTRPMGVFRLTNTINSKILIGGTPNLDAAKNRYEFVLKMGSCDIKELQQDWNEYGEEAFIFETLEQIKPVDDLKHDYKKEIEALEQKWLDELEPYGDKGYNKLRTHR
ncbi:GIY-YIG nuclease family protein [Paenibacillus eucommiae]|uniref:GIY-YIG nuclease family protein n=1 Tax=Paenibacillus eucommiae TaxID=1355755 RepID=A0ABS4INE6_9BACL|nr:GIY-YIG nuclease family protein [Paenibacillus eucommiae]MBP1989097.1 hypothetical protein [Paenibacillus eucommiae]